MRVISKAKLRDYWGRHPDARAALEAWYRVAEKADWGAPDDVRLTYRTADPIGEEFVVFDVGRNKYRLVVCVDYRRRIVYIWDVLTHRDYDRIDFDKLAEEKKRSKKGRPR